MDFTPDSTNVKTMFNSYPSLVVPNFQRDYCWDRDNYSLFLKDILNCLYIDNNELKTKDYFIGTMVFSGSKDDDEFLDVIDGQQRLTVITILISVIVDKFKKINKEKLVDSTFKYIKREDDYGRQVPKLKSETSYPFFEGYIQSLEKAENLKPATEEEENIEVTYKYFDTELKEDNLKKNYQFLENIKYVEILTTIRDLILKMNIISIVTKDKKVGYEIFEILNAKGKNLASIDMIKNTILSVFHDDINTRDKLTVENWEKIKQNLRSRESDVGFATFYRHYWLSKYSRTTNAKLYDSFKNTIKESVDTYYKFVCELEEESENYIKIVKPNISIDYNDRKEYYWLVQSLNAIENAFGVKQSRIVFMALFSLRSKELISSKSFKKAVKYIEDFIFAYSSILKGQANIYESRLSSLAIMLRNSKNKSDTNKILNENLYSLFDDRVPDRSEFVSSFKSLKFSKKPLPTNMITKYALNKISSSFDNKEVFNIDSSVEHIISEDTNIDIVSNIGNLICLETTLNQEADNLCFGEKLEIYKKSHYSQMKEFCNKYNDFDENMIDKRANLLAEYYYDNILFKEE